MRHVRIHKTNHGLQLWLLVEAMCVSVSVSVAVSVSVCVFMGMSSHVALYIDSIVTASGPGAGSTM